MALDINRPVVMNGRADTHIGIYASTCIGSRLKSANFLSRYAEVYAKFIKMNVELSIARRTKRSVILTEMSRVFCEDWVK